MTDAQRRQALPFLITELEQQEATSTALAEKHEAQAKIEMEKAHAERANINAYSTLRLKLERELNGLSATTPPKSQATSSNRTLPDVIAEILQQHPEGLTKNQIAEKLAERGRPVKGPQLASLLSLTRTFQNEKLGPSHFLWRYVEPQNGSESVEQPTESQPHEDNVEAPKSEQSTIF